MTSTEIPFALGSTLPDHTQLPDSDGNFVKNFQEHPQSILLTDSITPVLQQLHPDGNYLKHQIGFMFPMSHRL